jgi:membrane-associated phospholipid phosphatase
LFVLLFSLLPVVASAQAPTGEGTREGATGSESVSEAAEPDSTTTDVTERGEGGEDVARAFESAIDGPEAVPSERPLRVAWRPEWPRYSFDELVLTAGLGLLLIAAELLPTAAFEPNWTGGILFDDGVREGLRLRAYPQRESSALAAEVMQWVLIGFPFVFDALSAAGLGENSWDLAFQMGLVSVEAYVVSLVVWRITSLLARRERPLTAACEAGDTSPPCSDPNVRATESFFSNQTMNAFTGAGLMCLHHTAMPLYGDEAADAATCIGGLTVGAMVGLLRVMSDFEYLTDVITGALVGLASGWLLPYLLHYQGGARPELRPPVAAIPAPFLGPNDTYGLQVVGIF